SAGATASASSPCARAVSKIHAAACSASSASGFLATYSVIVRRASRWLFSSRARKPPAGASSAFIADAGTKSSAKMRAATAERQRPIECGSHEFRWRSISVSRETAWRARVHSKEKQIHPQVTSRKEFPETNTEKRREPRMTRIRADFPDEVDRI